MDKNEYMDRLDEINELAERGDFKTAAECADAIDWRKVKSVRTLCLVSEIYAAVKDFESSERVLKYAYKRSPASKAVLYRLADTNIQLGDADDAARYIKEFSKISPHDTSRYILRYRLLRMQKAPLDDQIEVLKEYKNREYTERYAYELAKLYMLNGQEERCVEEIDDMALWFGEGPYVLKALELKKQVRPLTAGQEAIYEREAAAKAREAARRAEAKRAKADMRTALEREEAARRAEAEQPATPIEKAEKRDAVEDAEAAASATSAAAGELVAERMTKENVRAAVDKLDSAADEAVASTSMDANLPNVTIAPAENDFAEDKTTQAQKELSSSIKAVFAGITTPENAPRAQAASLKEMPADAGAQKPAEVDLEALFAETSSGLAAELATGGYEMVGSDVASEDEFEEQTADESAKPVSENEKGGAGAVLAGAAGIAAAAAAAGGAAFGAGKAAAGAAGEGTERTVKAAAEDASDDFSDAAEALADKGEEAAAEDASDDFSDAAEALVDEAEEAAADAGAAGSAAIGTAKAAADGAAAQAEEAAGVWADEDAAAEAAKSAALAADDAARAAEIEEEPSEDDPWSAAAKSLEAAEAQEEPEERDDIETDETLGITRAFDFKEEIKALEAEGLSREDAAREAARKAEAENAAYVGDAAEESEAESEEAAAAGLAAAGLAGAGAAGLAAAGIAGAAGTAGGAGEAAAELPPELFADEAEIEMVKQNTAPLNFDEISNAIESEGGEEVSADISASIMDAPEMFEIRTVEPHPLDDTQRRLLSYFAEVPGIGEQMTMALADVHNNAGDKTSNAGNVLIMGRPGSGKTRLSEAFILSAAKDLNLKAVKVARVVADDINSKDGAEIVAKMSGGFLVIEAAGALSDTVVEEMNQAMEFRTDDLVIILEDEKKDLREMLARHPEFAKKFTSTIVVPVFTNDELVTFARTYAKERGYKLDEMATLALYTEIGENQRIEEPMTVARVRDIVDRAINRVSAHRFGRRRVKDATGRIIIREKDFDL